jgi:uncharacterized membrane protein YhaH (DUF805 family)
VKRYLRLWFTFEERVDRRTYLLSGLALAALKFAGDLLIVWAGTGQMWDPFEYQSSINRLLNGPLKDAPPWVLVTMVAWSIPFLWIGISMSMRRALDAGFTAWFALLFFVPGIKYLLMAGLSIAPSQAPSEEGQERPRPYERRLPSALMAIAAGTVLGLGLLACSVFLFDNYGAALFLGMPFIVGAVTAWLFNRRYPATAAETQQVVIMTMACVGGATLATAAEGALCLIMAAPLGIGLGIMGAWLGRNLALFDHEPVYHVLVGVMAMPLAASLDDRVPVPELREVRTSIEVNASPEQVWKNLIKFPPLPEPNDWVFRAGIAYPMRGEIRGEGVGAVRYCYFSTGAFVEPITRWEPGRRLSFDVASQPRPMEEWSPYADITPPHLDGYFESKRGEFRLIALPGGRTRLEGSTWYVMKIQPAMYWSLFGDAFIHRIHNRVLEHIKENAEGTPVPVKSASRSR